MLTSYCAFAVCLAPFYENTSHYMDILITGKSQSIHRACVWRWSCPDSHPVQGNTAWSEISCLLESSQTFQSLEPFPSLSWPLGIWFSPSLLRSIAVKKGLCISTRRLFLLHSPCKSLHVSVSAAFSRLAGCDIPCPSRRSMNSSSYGPQSTLRKIIQNEHLARH